MDDLDDVRAHIAHHPKYTASARDLAALARRARELLVGDLQTGEVTTEPCPPPMTPEEFMRRRT